MNPEKIWVEFDDDWFAGDGIVYVQPFDPADGSVEYVRADRYREAVELLRDARPHINEATSVYQDIDVVLSDEDR